MASTSFLVFFVFLTVLSSQDAEGCGWISTELTGTVQSPNFPNSYPNNQNCLYIITAPEGYQITLTFSEFDLEGHSSCLFDYLEIRDGDSETSPLIKRLCNTSLPSPVRTFGNQMRIKFFSDGSVTGQGFRATFASANLQAPYFLITSSFPSEATGGDIHRMDVETRSNYIIPMSGNLYAPIAVDFDPKEQTIYWTEVGLIKGIRASDLDGEGVHTVLNTGQVSHVDGLAVDPLSRLIFYTDTGRDIIAMVTMSTFLERTIISADLDQPRAIVLDTENGVMFWTDWGMESKIERANYDGSNRTTVIFSGLVFINGLALDVANERLYWVDAGTDRIEMSDLYGNGRTVIFIPADNPHHFFGLARLGNILYTTDWLTGTSTGTSLLLQYEIGNTSARIYGSSIVRRMNDIHVVAPSEYSEDDVNGCGENNGGCEVICVPLPNNGRKCLCPDGESHTSDQTSCEPGSVTPTPPSGSDFTVTVTTTETPPFDTKGDLTMTFACDPDVPDAYVTSYLWSVPCTTQTGNTCAYQPDPPGDDGKRVTCTVTTSDGRVGLGSVVIELNYPPTEAPYILGHTSGAVYQEGQTLTLICSVNGGKPLVKSVLFFCGSHEDTTPDIFGVTEVHSTLTIELTMEDNGKSCVCTAQWKDTNWYSMSTSFNLRVNGSVTPTPPPGSDFTVVVTTTETPPFDTEGDLTMTFACDPDVPDAYVTSYLWSVPCTRQTGNTCAYQPDPPGDDGKSVTCTVKTSDGRVGSGSVEIELNYPPIEAPYIHGHTSGAMYQEGQTLTLTCSVNGGKPLVKSVLFFCGSHEDTTPDIFGVTEVHSTLTIKLTMADNGKPCVCTAQWKDTNWYRMSTSFNLRVNGTLTPPPKERINIPLIVGCSVGGVVIIAVIIIVVIIVRRKRRPDYMRPKPRRQEQLAENPYSTLGAPRQNGESQRPPYIINGAFEGDQCSVYNVPDENGHSSQYNTLDEMAAAIRAGTPVEDYLTPQSGKDTPMKDTPVDDYLTPKTPSHLAEQKPVPCSRSGNAYLHPINNSPALNDYVKFKVNNPTY